MNAVDRIVGGLEKRTKITTADERQCIANHEAGHATLSWLLEHANPLVKVTIVPRGKGIRRCLVFTGRTPDYHP